jgi:phosphatidylglycerophosphate synthase
VLRRSQLTEDAAPSLGERNAPGLLEEAREPDVDGDGEPAPGDAAPDAVLLATIPAAGGGPAAALEVLGTTAVGRLLAQLETLGVRRAWVVTRPRWRKAVEAATGEGSAGVTVVEADGLGDDLRAVAEIAERIAGPVVVGNAHVVTHREALARLLADPRVTSGVLATSSPTRAGRSFEIRVAFGDVVSAASAYHRVGGATDYFLGLMKLDSRDRGRLVAAAREVAEWQLGTGTEADLASSHAAGASDAASLALVSLVRNGAELSSIKLSRFFYAAPLSSADAELAAKELSGLDEERLRLESAVKANDSFFTTYFVSPYSKYLARLAARRGWTPNAVTTVSLLVGVAAAAAFAFGSRPALIVGALLLQLSFTIDCVDGQLARYTRTFSRLGAWLDSVFDRAKEYLVYAGLAIGASRGFDDDVWILAAAALALQTVRHFGDFSYSASLRAAVEPMPTLPLDHPDDTLAPEPPSSGKTVGPRSGAKQRRLVSTPLAALRGVKRSSAAGWAHKILKLPIGERFALISISAAIATPRVTFIALLVWGGAAAAYTVFGRVVVAYGLMGRIFLPLLR